MTLNFSMGRNNYNSWAKYTKGQGIKPLNEVVDEKNNKKRKSFKNFFKNIFSKNEEELLKFEIHPTKLQTTPHNPNATGYVDLKEIVKNEQKKLDKTSNPKIKTINDFSNDVYGKPISAKSNYQGINNDEIDETQLVNVFTSKEEKINPDKNKQKNKTDNNYFSNLINKTKTTFEKVTNKLANNEYFENALYFALGAGTMLTIMNHKQETPVILTQPDQTKEIKLEDSYLKPSSVSKPLIINEELIETTKSLAGIEITKEYDLNTLLKNSRKKGLTGVLETISHEKPNYENGGNIDELAKIIGINLYEENVELEKEFVNSKYQKNGINDVLTKKDVHNIYNKLEELKGNNEIAEELKTTTEQQTTNNIYSNNELTDLVLENNGKQPKNLTNKDYQNISNTFNSKRNKYEALDEIMQTYSLTEEQATKEVFQSKEYAGVESIKYSTTIKNELTKQDSELLMDLYLNNTVEKAKELYKEKTDIDVSTNFYRALDDVSEKLGQDKIRKRKMTQDDKEQLLNKIKNY